VSDASRHKPWMRGTIILVAAVILGCNRSIDENGAAQIARDFVVAGQPSGTQFLELKPGTPELRGDTWRVQVDVRLVYPGDVEDVPAHYIIDVDSSTGVPRIYAQG
jgi:hypothetical protein